MERDADEQRKAGRKKAIELIDRAQAAAVQIFSGPNGQLVLEWLALKSHAHRSTFRLNAREHAFREGKRALFLDLTDLMELSPEAILATKERKHLR